MYIKNISIENFKGFRDIQTAEFEPAFNVIVGQNNSGKSALLEALALNPTNKPHLSPSTIPIPGNQPQYPKFRFVIEITKEELKDCIKNSTQRLELPLPASGAEFSPGSTYVHGRNESYYQIADLFWSRERFSFELGLSTRPDSSQFWEYLNSPTLGAYTVQPNPNNASIWSLSSEGGLHFEGLGVGSEQRSLGLDIVGYARSKVYHFAAERFNLSRSANGNNPILSAQARNLPEVLANLQPNRDRFERFNSSLREIVPGVKHISVRPIGSNQVEIDVWTIDPATERLDLVVPLDQCGTGIGQVLAILYVVFNSDRPMVLLLDEPQTFLHPGAVEKLIQVLARSPQHQYIIATHSPNVITSCSPRTITIAKHENGVSNLTQMKAKEITTQQACLSELGARLSDVFGADRIIWVEGPTEERCFPHILKAIKKTSLAGTEILALRAVGDFSGKHADTVVDIYNRLSKSKSLMPPSIAFIFDAECKENKSRVDLVKKSDDRARFIPARMFENFLLSPTSIANVMNSIEGFRPSVVTPDEVAQSIDKYLKLSELYCSKEHFKDEANWKTNVDAAKLLHKVFSELSETRVAYDKVLHGSAIVSAILENEPQHLQKLADFLEQATF